MSAERSAGDQLIELSKLCELLGMEQSDKVEAHFAEAAALARELFPPMAKPLVWTGFNGLCADLYEVYPQKDGSSEAYFAGFIFWHGEGLAAAKAACEAHHQSRFKELLA